jgi:hypothetical protein
LLDFVRRRLSSSPEPSSLIVSSYPPSAVWRFFDQSINAQSARKAHSIQAALAHKINFSLDQDSTSQLHVLDPDYSTGI